jgi:hypothetical protein
MPRNSDVSNLSRRWFLAVAGGAAAANAFAARTDSELTQAALAPPPVADYPVKIDVRNADNLNKHPKYSTPKLSNASTVSGVSAGEKFSWRAQTKYDPSNQYHLAIIFKNGSTPFVDARTGTVPIPAFYGTENDEAAGGLGINAKISQSVTDGDEFDYYVVVFDHKLNQIYIDDPVIIIGDEQLVAERKLIKAEKELKTISLSNPADNEQLQKIEDDLGKLVAKLKKKK